jgi:hypothetical protein
VFVYPSTHTHTHPHTTHPHTHTHTIHTHKHTRHTHYRRSHRHRQVQVPQNQNKAAQRAVYASPRPPTHTSRSAVPSSCSSEREYTHIHKNLHFHIRGSLSHENGNTQTHTFICIYASAEFARDISISALTPRVSGRGIRFFTPAHLISGFRPKCTPLIYQLCTYIGVSAWRNSVGRSSSLLKSSASTSRKRCISSLSLSLSLTHSLTLSLSRARARALSLTHTYRTWQSALSSRARQLPQILCCVLLRHAKNSRFLYPEVRFFLLL